MIIRETKKKYGAEFKVVGSIDEINKVHRWMNQNDIRNLYTRAHQRDRFIAYYYIRNEISIMAFKLRWL